LPILVPNAIHEIVVNDLINNEPLEQITTAILKGKGTIHPSKEGAYDSNGSFEKAET